MRISLILCNSYIKKKTKPFGTYLMLHMIQKYYFIISKLLYIHWILIKKTKKSSKKTMKFSLPFCLLTKHSMNLAVSEQLES